MANISILDLEFTGSELFRDSESYMDKISENALSDIVGGGLDGNAIAEAAIGGLIVASAVASSLRCATVAVAIGAYYMWGPADSAY